MKRIFWTSFFILAAVAIGVAAATAEELKAQSEQHFEAAKAKQKALKNKTYSGTFEQILAARVADVNDINLEIAQAKAAAAAALELDGKPAAAQQFVAGVIADQTRETDHTRKYTNGAFLLAVEEMCKDPNSFADPEHPEDPNELQARIAELQAACLEIVRMTGGV